MSSTPVPAWRGPWPRSGVRPLQWFVGTPTFRGDAFDRPRRASPWAGHRWFVYDLVGALRPTRVVELGTHFGCSYFAICQAAEEHGAPAELIAVDTWRGDPHAGFYDDVFELFEEWRSQQFPAVDTKALRMTFDEALGEVEDGTVDLLHIDGLHTYDAVSHDHATWSTKLTPTGTVLFHDVAIDSGYESSDYWSEIADRDGGFSFFHSFGLGVLTSDPRLAALLASDSFARVARYYPAIAAADLGLMRIEDDGMLLAERQQIVEHQDRLIADRDEAIVAQTRMIDERNALIAHQDRLIAARDEAIAAQARLIDDKQAIIDEQERMLTDRDQMLAVQARLIEDLSARAPARTRTRAV